MAPSLPRVLTAASLAAALALLALAGVRLDLCAPIETPPRCLVAFEPRAEPEAVLTCITPPPDEPFGAFDSDAPLEDDVVEEVVLSGGAGGRFGGRFGGSRSFTSRQACGVAIRRAGGSGLEPPTEEYVAARAVGFRDPREHPLSTFSVDVDTASYTNVRRFLAQGELPPPDAVRVEEMLNALDYAYPAPTGEYPLALHAEVATCPWSPSARLLRVALQARRVSDAERRPLNLVFLIDVSGSMQDERKLPLAQAGLRLLATRLDARDTVGIVTYASGVAVALEPVPGDHTEAILAVVDRLRADGSTNGQGGLDRAYALADQHARPEAESRVLLLTDGDFNVGITDADALVARIRERARAGVTLTVLGFGYGNLKDARLERLADDGDGHYAYVDSELEARRLFADGFAGTLVTAAKDAKVQVELNPAEVGAYRLIGYANRRLADLEFEDDARDAGDVGAGHAVTALYEIVPRGVPVPAGALDAEPWPVSEATTAFDGELCRIAVRCKPPGASVSIAIETRVRDQGRDWTDASPSFRLAAAVAMLGETLARSPYAAPGGIERAHLIALASHEGDPRRDLGAQAQELLDLARLARGLSQPR